MKAPEKIYLQVCGDCPAVDCHNCKFKFEDLEDNVTWCKDKIFKKDIEYTRTDAFIEKACKLLKCKYDDIGLQWIRGVNVSDVIDDFRKAMEE